VSWWRANRWWLLVLPVAVVVMLGASAYRVQTFWWESGLHRAAATAESGRFVHVKDDFEDSLGPTRRSYDVRLDAVTEIDTLPQRSRSDPTSVPDGVTAWRVDLTWRARPDQDLNACRVLLVDASGARYGGDLTDPLRQIHLCVPEDTPGPRSPLSKGDRRGQAAPGTERPEEWRTHPIVLVREGARPRAAWVTFFPPDYVVLPVPR
jgi:hypothetical protein